MFKKLKDKLAEEVKSSPQRIQQFAQAAQAAVTSASSSISDITNNDLFSIGDNDNSQGNSVRTSTTVTRATEPNMFQDVSLMQPTSMQASTEEIDYPPRHDQSEAHHQRRLSNSSFASDVSFRLPSYESPSLYHLQSDMEVSASEADERGFSSGTASLDRVTKEQLYAAYKRTQQRYEKYRTQYADLARHYKFLERDNAKARSVLVETQDKALRRISELREQCTLEQSAKAHLEKALRMEIDERQMKIETLNTKISLMQSNGENKESPQNIPKNEGEVKETVKELQLIDFSGSVDRKTSGDDGTDVGLINKTEKLEQLVNKYKESLKVSKEKNAQLTTEMHILTNEIENMKKENEQLKNSTVQLTEARKKIFELQEITEELQNKLNTYEFNKMKEKSTLELDLQKALEEIEQLRGKIEVFNKREEEYAISLAENKLSIHKELESKEAEIKTLKDNLTASKNEIQSLNIVVSDYKLSLSSIEEEKSKLKKDVTELNLLKSKVTEKETQIQELTHKCKSLEQYKTKADEEYKCLQLQHKQETAEKLAMIDRNTYLETKNTQLTEENAKKSAKVNELENQLVTLKKGDEEHEKQNCEENSIERNQLLEELESWRNKYYTMESEIQDERDELVKLQSEIEKLLQNHEVIQTRNSQLLDSLSELTSENSNLKQNVENFNKKFVELANTVKSLKKSASKVSEEARNLKIDNGVMISGLKDKIIEIISASKNNEIDLQIQYDKLNKDFNTVQNDLVSIKEQLTLKLQENMENYASEKNSMSKELENLNVNYDRSVSEINKLMDENKVLMSKANELETLNASLQSTISREREQNSPLHDKVPVLEKENKMLLQKLQDIEIEKDQFKIAVAELEDLRVKNKRLLQEIEDYSEKKVYIEKLENDIKLMNQENNSLKNQSQTIATNLNALEAEISDVRKSHAEMEREKDHLNATIKKLEESEHAKKLQSTICIQTDENSSTIDLVVEENKVLKEKCEQFKQEKETLYEKVISVENAKDGLLADIALQNKHVAEYEEENKSLKVTNTELLTKVAELEKVYNEVMVKSQNEVEMAEKVASMKIEYDALKDENRRLSSEIEGLQTYLAKISKENSTLNDKLRELIASSEHVDRNENTSRDFGENGQSDTDKLNDLLRENTLLVEENLELKDQLRSQNYIETPNNNMKADLKNVSELEILKEKYDNVLATKSKYEKQLMDLEHINRSVNGNMQSVQENNEKLRLSNEKLERRLDEALVSLRHLHSLQENTELEYLRNILYEYLTGSGTHSITLAKVLAAVVKFDEMQTNIVLQKEKERQGLLRQLGLL